MKGKQPKKFFLVPFAVAVFFLGAFLGDVIGDQQPNLYYLVMAVVLTSIGLYMRGQHSKDSLE